MNALNFALIAFAAHTLIAEPDKDWVAVVVRLLLVVGFPAIVGYRLGGWM